ncbi:alpha/beta hydrolase family protein [Paenibacillus methanolicus]|uniref:Putative esterase n=1 Tax=Paenibacillus methanolicus TaxID=582686 RepID=A0A5S5CIP2_9BACL|nr:putative esterase [Paenibacillus methanolicus]
MAQQPLKTAPFEFPLEHDLTLRGEVRVSGEEGRRPVALLVHGFKGFKDWGFFPYAAEQLARSGFAVVTFNFSCNGVGHADFDELHKFGRNTYSREQADLTALLERWQAGELPLSDRMDAARTALIGHSRGGGNSLMFAASHPEAFQAVVSWNGIADANLFGDEFREQVLLEGIGYVENARTKQQMPITAAFFEDLDQNRDRFDIVKAIARLPLPVLTIQGDRDAQRLVLGQERLRQAAPHQRHLLIEGANHTFGAIHPFAGTTPHLERALELTVDFLKEYR